MLDLHAHILPGIDDGADTIEESIQMCEMAYKDGIRTIVATPHIGKFQNSKEIILKKTHELKDELLARQIDINLFCGADLEFTAEVLDFANNNSLVTINNSRYLLLDIPNSLLPPNVERHINSLLEKGIVPIISHPERCIQIQEDLGILYRVIKLGVVVQITAASITGKMGSHAESAVLTILKHNLAHVIATDTHGINKRPPVLSEAVNIASGIIGRDLALAMVTTNPQNIIDDKPLTLPEPKSL